MVALNAYYNTGVGGRVTTSEAALYGYQIALDNTKIVKSITLPNTRNVVIVAMSLSTSSTPVSVAGSYVYTPPAGIVPAVGTVPLSVVFTPTNANYLPATKTVNLIVNKAVLTVTANDQTIPFGGSLAPYTDSITGFVNGDAPSVVTGAATLSTIPATCRRLLSNYGCARHLSCDQLQLRLRSGYPHHFEDQPHHYVGEPCRYHLRNGAL
jgi:hypothetical protein